MEESWSVCLKNVGATDERGASKVEEVLKSYGKAEFKNRHVT